MDRMVEGAGVALHVRDRGRGVPVLLVHGLAADGGRWDPLELPGTRLLVPDRRACGRSQAPEPYGRTTIEEQAEDLVAVLDALGARGAIAGGEDFGALLLLDVLKRHPGALTGAVLLEPPLFAFVPEAAEQLAGERTLLEAALRQDGILAAIEQWAGPRPVPDGVERAFFADYGALTGWPVTRGELRAMHLPLVILVRDEAPRHVRRAAEALAELAPQAELRAGDDVPGALRDVLSRTAPRP